MVVLSGDGQKFVDISHRDYYTTLTHPVMSSFLSRDQRPQKAQTADRRPQRPFHNAIVLYSIVASAHFLTWIIFLDFTRCNSTFHIRI